jgi:hypothetical protein
MLDRSSNLKVSNLELDILPDKLDVELPRYAGCYDLVDHHLLFHPLIFLCYLLLTFVWFPFPLFLTYLRLAWSSYDSLYPIWTALTYHNSC